MSHFLVIFDRHRRSDPEIVEVADASQAQDRLFEIERELRDDPDRGVVLLVADQVDQLERTHAQYFKPVDELTRLVTS